MKRQLDSKAIRKMVYVHLTWTQMDKKEMYDQNYLEADRMIFVKHLRMQL